ncbi:hypothetical protein [Streptomyces alkaliterrae]|nr:hypothetical protein [Streptomyces alkaliterrae]
MLENGWSRRARPYPPTDKVTTADHAPDGGDRAAATAPGDG